MVKNDRHYCFTHPSGEDIYLFPLHNNKGTQILISNYGAIIQSYMVKKLDGSIHDIVLGFDNMEDYIASSYLDHYCWLGAAVGRYANRIKNAGITIDGQQFLLSKNNGEDQLHGGMEGFDKKIWKVVSYDSHHLQLSYTSPDADEGFPGTVAVNLRFELNNEDEFSYTYTAITDQPTAINLTHHSYFNLNNGSGTIVDHTLRIPASYILEQDANAVATGNLVPVDSGLYDFRNNKKINSNWNPEHGYDQSYPVDDDTKKIRLVAEASSEKSGLQLKVWSTEPVVHLYTGRWIPSLKGKNGNRYGAFSGFCLETQVHPNAINIPAFPPTILRPGETYHHQTIYKVEEVK